MSNSNSESSRKLTANVKAAGCAAKISSLELKQVLSSIKRPQCPELLTSLDNFEDAAVYKITEDIAIVETVDFFPPVVDDPFLFGRIAAVNALSDVYAMGGNPVIALNILCFPTCDYPLEVVEEILKGGQAACSEANVTIAGGHSIQGPEPVYGLAVTGVVDPRSILTNGGAKDGDLLLVTKPLGTGVMLLGLKGELLKDAEQKQLLQSLTGLNKGALEIAKKYEPSAATDITGFGMIGHTCEMALASGLSAYLYIDDLPFFAGARSLAAQGFVPAGAYGNRNTFGSSVINLENVETAIQDLLFDPQTSGGLMFALKEEPAMRLLAELLENGYDAAIVGGLQSGTPGSIFLNQKSSLIEAKK
ncbi:MAG: selenide, water dikinase SelD [Candidatus Melainabacteria bacterium]|nr:selenide, water dikinase SelD [Candidatus Melainabacteria bacterium]